MKKSVAILLSSLFALVLTSTAAFAAPIPFYTGDGGDILVSSVVPGSTTIVNRHPAWYDLSLETGDPADTIKWISYQNTGYGGVIAPNAPSRNHGDETALFERQFNIGGPGDFNFKIVADDTAWVRLTGPGGYSNTLFTAFPGQIDPCAPGGSGVPVGCVKADMGSVSLTRLLSGLYTLQYGFFQTNFDVAGLSAVGSYSGVPDVPEVPEPASMLLVGSGLLGLAAKARKKYITERAPKVAPTAV